MGVRVAVGDGVTVKVGVCVGIGVLLGATPGRSKKVNGPQDDAVGLRRKIVLTSPASLFSGPVGLVVLSWYPAGFIASTARKQVTGPSQ